jgi:hypothetical protein
MDQVSMKYANIFHCKKDPPKFTQMWIFWFENKPSGNPGLSVHDVTCLGRRAIELRTKYVLWNGKIKLDWFSKSKSDNN